MATKSLVSATATLGIERRGGGQGREDPGIPGCHPRSRPRVPRLLPPPLAAASARETRRSGAEERGEEQGDPRPAATTTLAHPLRRLRGPATHASRAGGAREAPYGQETFSPDAPFPPDLEVSGNRGRSRYPESFPRHPRRPPPSKLRGLTRGAAGAPHAPRANGRCWRHDGATRSPAASGGERAGRRQGGERKRRGGPSSSARRLRASPRVSAHGRAALLPPPPPALRPSLPAARRPPPGAPCTTRPAAHRALSLPLPPGEARAQAHTGSLRG